MLVPGAVVGVFGVCVLFVNALMRFATNDVQSTGAAGGVGVFGVIDVGVTGVIGDIGDVGICGVPPCGADHVICARDGLAGLRTKFISDGG